ncbi:hypothetical protein DFS34DRAFT_183042 [Phlyctochytrium arcticum]|nr:hypothetical protein DFS34DRAFT_183042 [Phlyctochytrium arcticum]
MSMSDQTHFSKRTPRCPADSQQSPLLACDSETSNFAFQPSRSIASNPEEHQQLHQKDLDYFRIFVAPASGPSGLVTTGFEARLKALHTKGQLNGPKWLVGSSTGAMRFLALIGSIAFPEINLTEELMRHYCWMMYKDGDTPRALRPMMEQLYKIVAPENLIQGILDHPEFRVAIVVSNLRSMYQNLPDWALRGLFVTYALGNLVSDSVLPTLCERIVFYSGDEIPTFMANGAGGVENVRFVKLTTDNIYQVLHGTTCIPFVQERCEYIHSAGHGLYVDGALTDYMFNVKLTEPSDRALLLSDQPTPQVFPTALDAYFRWRSTPPASLHHVSVLHVSGNFAAKMIDGQLPRLRDWFEKHYIAQPDLRRRKWQDAYHLSQETWPNKLSELIVPQCSHELTPINSLLSWLRNIFVVQNPLAWIWPRVLKERSI